MFAMAIRDNARDDGDSHDDNHDAERETSGREGQRFVVLEAHLALLDQLLQYHDPVLAARMEACRLSADAYATPWYVCSPPAVTNWCVVESGKNKYFSGTVLEQRHFVDKSRIFLSHTRLLTLCGCLRR